MARLEFAKLKKLANLVKGLFSCKKRKVDLRNDTEYSAGKIDRSDQLLLRIAKKSISQKS